MNWWQTGTEIEGSYSLEQRQAPVNYKGLIVILLTYLILAAWGSVQFIAYNFRYIDALGDPLCVFEGMPIYSPSKIFSWLPICYKYSLYNEIALKSIMVSIFSFFLAIALPLLFLYSNKIAAKHKYQQKTLTGSAHWADKDEIIDAGLLPRVNEKATGVYVGAWVERIKVFGFFIKEVVHYLRHSGPEHILCFAPTRSGKGVGLVFPTLLSWNKSCFVFDIKGENYAKTSGFRKKLGQYILKFDPTDDTGTCARFNPLSEIRIGTSKEQGDVENVCLILADPDGKGTIGGDKYWIQTAESLISGVVMHLLYKCKNEKKEPTLGMVYQLLTDPTRKLTDTMKDMLNYKHDPNYTMGWRDSTDKPTATHPYVAAKAREFLNKPEKEAGSVLSTATNAMKIFFDPVVNKNLSRSTFKLNDLMNADKPTSLYICVPPADLARFSALIRILITQIVTVLANDMKYGVDAKGRETFKSEYKYQLLLMLDEFPALGAMEKFESQLAYIAGYGLKAYLITQDLTQLQKAYTKEESIMSNAHLRIAYAPNKVETANAISQMLGKTTIIKKIRSSSSSKSGLSVSRSVQEQQRDLLDPSEVMRLPGPIKDQHGNIKKPGDMLIIPAGKAPIYGRQILYFQDPVFTARSEIHHVPMSDVISANPFEVEEKEEIFSLNLNEDGKMVEVVNEDPEITDEDKRPQHGEEISEAELNEAEEAFSDDDTYFNDLMFGEVIATAVQNGELRIGDKKLSENEAMQLFNSKIADTANADILNEQQKKNQSALEERLKEAGNGNGEDFNTAD